MWEKYPKKCPECRHKTSIERQSEWVREKGKPIKVIKIVIECIECKVKTSRNTNNHVDVWNEFSKEVKKKKEMNQNNSNKKPESHEPVVIAIQQKPGEICSSNVMDLISPNMLKLFYITHIDNLASIMQYGILSKTSIEQRKISHVKIKNQEVVQIRENKIIGRHTLSYFVNVYFQPRNPMLTTVLKKNGISKIIIVEVAVNINKSGIYITDGNAARPETKPYDSSEYDEIIPKLKHIFNLKYWGKYDREVMAECLIPEEIPSENIKAIHIYDDDKIENQVREAIELKLPVIREKDMFFGGKYGNERN